MKGYAALGEMLAGNLGAEGVYEDTLNKKYDAAYALARAREKQSQEIIDAVQAEHFQRIPGMGVALGISDEEASLLAAGGGNAQQLMSARNTARESGYRQAAVQQATLGDYDGANAQLFGVASGPVKTNEITGGIATNSYQVGAPLRMTPLGESTVGVNESTIHANNARATASYAQARLDDVKADAGGFSPNEAGKYTTPTQTAIDNAFVRPGDGSLGSESEFDQEAYADFVRWRDANPHFNGPQALDQYLLARASNDSGRVRVIDPRKPGSMTIQPPGPPVAGARKAPDGHWYVQREGRYYRVDK
jgi:hypothetical protein